MYEEYQGLRWLQIEFHQALPFERLAVACGVLLLNCVNPHENDGMLLQTPSQDDVLAMTCRPSESASFSLNLAWPSLLFVRSGNTLVSSSLPMLAALLIPVDAMAGALGVWRLAADPGWTSHFFIPGGFLSHWQVWFAVAIGARVSSGRLKQMAGR